MPKHSKPRSGSKQFWPRKRAKRIYPDISFNQSFLSAHDVEPMTFAGWKVGMTHVQYVDNNPKSPTYNQIITKPVTVVETPSLFVCALRFYSHSPYGLKILGETWSDIKYKNLKRKIEKQGEKKFDIEKSKKDITDVRLVVHTIPEKSGVGKKKPELFEVCLGGSDINEKIKYAQSVLGKELDIKDVFSDGEIIDVTGVTKGHGFTGPVKRFGIKIQTRKDEQHHRHAGTKGQERPGRQRWQVPMPGQYGFFRRTELNKKILKIVDKPDTVIPKGGFLNYGIPKSRLIVIEGSLPGPAKRLIMIRKAMRAKKKPQPVEIKYISTESKQGV